MYSLCRFGLILASARREQASRSLAGAGGVRRLTVLRDSDEELEAEDGHQQHEEENAMDWVQATLKVANDLVFYLLNGLKCLFASLFSEYIQETLIQKDLKL